MPKTYSIIKDMIINKTLNQKLNDSAIKELNVSRLLNTLGKTQRSKRLRMKTLVYIENTAVPLNVKVYELVKHGKHIFV